MGMTIDDSLLYESGYNKGFKDGIRGSIPKADYEARLKADMVAMLEDLRLEIEKIFDNRPLPCSHYQRTLFYGEVDDLILDKINSLKEASDA